MTFSGVTVVVTGVLVADCTLGLGIGVPSAAKCGTTRGAVLAYASPVLVKLEPTGSPASSVLAEKLMLDVAPGCRSKVLIHSNVC